MFSAGQSPRLLSNIYIYEYKYHLHLPLILTSIIHKFILLLKVTGARPMMRRPFLCGLIRKKERKRNQYIAMLSLSLSQHLSTTISPDTLTRSHQSYPLLNKRKKKKYHTLLYEAYVTKNHGYSSTWTFPCVSSRYSFSCTRQPKLTTLESRVDS